MHTRIIQQQRTGTHSAHIGAGAEQADEVFEQRTQVKGGVVEGQAPRLHTLQVHNVP